MQLIERDVQKVYSFLLIPSLSSMFYLLTINVDWRERKLIIIIFELYKPLEMKKSYQDK